MKRNINKVLLSLLFTILINALFTTTSTSFAAECSIDILHSKNVKNMRLIASIPLEESHLIQPDLDSKIKFQDFDFYANNPKKLNQKGHI